jgi:hypothetical protein
MKAIMVGTPATAGTKGWKHNVCPYAGDIFTFKIKFTFVRFKITGYLKTIC